MTTKQPSKYVLLGMSCAVLYNLSSKTVLLVFDRKTALQGSRKFQPIPWK